jgi:hypothetical protein
MPYLRENAATLLESTAGINLNAAGTTSLFTVPAGKTAWITSVVLRDLSGDSDNTEISLGEAGDTDDWMMKLLLREHLDGADNAMILRPRHWLQASDTWDPGNIADGDEEAVDITCDDAELGDFAIASFSLDVADLVLDAQVTAADTVTCVLANNTGGAIDLASGTVRVRVWKFNDGFIEYGSGDVFTLEVTVAAGAAVTCSADVFGHLA